MNTEITSYIQSKANAWSASTLRSEHNRLLAVSCSLSLTAEAFYLRYKSVYTPYSLKTLMIRVSKFKEFQGDFSYKAFMQSNARLFRYVYTFKAVGITYEDALSKIKTIEHPETRQIAILMLTTGMRIHEALKYDGSGTIIGKGGKPRRVFSATAAPKNLTYIQVYRELTRIGLKPHDLRKLAASKLAVSGLSEADLMEVMGWNNIQTASKYLQPLLEDRLKRKVQEALNG